jgi:hypothetical protein
MVDRDIERLKEQIKFETEVMKFTALVGGFTPLRLVLAGLGFLSTLALGIVSWRFYKRVGLLIAQSKEVSA